MQFFAMSQLFANLGKRCWKPYRFFSILKYDAVLESSGMLKISTSHSSRILELNPLWLRDHCRCPECYNHKTHQRQFDLSSLPENLTVKAKNVTAASLQVTWSDGHLSTYEIPWLVQNTYEGRLWVEAGRRTRQVLWNKKAAENILKTEPVAHSDLGREDTVREVLNRLVKYGFAFVDGVPSDFEGTRLAAEKICRRTTNLFGDMWELGTGMQHQDTGYTNVALEAHTDNTYFSEPIGVMVFHCVEFSGTGGQSLLVDGFSIAKQFNEECPEGYRFLSEISTGSQYIEPGEHFLHCDSTFKHHPVTKELEQIRFNLYDRAPISTLPQSAMDSYYRYMKHLAGIVKRPENELWLQLRPGSMLLFDNFRVLHGRAAYEGTRHLVGTYFSRSDFLSRARAFNLVV